MADPKYSYAQLEIDLVRSKTSSVFGIADYKYFAKIEKFQMTEAK